MPIRALPEQLVHQIAAGEVVERPASVVKELIENSLDAGATQIDVETEGGGRALIRVRDDGDGIPPDELALAIAPHATSKISEASDLWRLGSFGFRGEALCSVAAVSSLTLTSRTRGTADAWSIECRFGAAGAPRPAAGAPGTCVEVRDLFDNVPARRHFLRAESAESARITDAVVNAALAHPQVAMKLRHGTRVAVDAPASADLLGRIGAVLGESLGADPLPVHAEMRVPDGAGGEWSMSVKGAVCRPESMRSTARFQRLFVNGRPVTERSLAHAAREAYRGLAEPSLVPAFVLMVECDPAAVDVNVHPQKLEVRWRSPDAAHRLVHRAVQDALRSGDLTRDASPILERLTARAADAVPASPSVTARPITVPAPDRGSRSTWMRTPAAPASAGRAPAARAPAGPAPADPVPAGGTHAHRPSAAPSPADGPATLPEVHAVATERFLQVDDSWIVLEEGGALVVIDQHALHERVMFEELRSRLSSGAVASQRMLVPATADVPPAAIERIESLTPLFARLGIEVSAAGPRSVAVHAFPTYLSDRGLDAARFVADALCDEALASAVACGDGTEAAVADMLDMRACKSAVRAGERLTPHEIAALLSRRHAIERASNCPHGRPTTLRIPLDEIARRFGR
jgi:DNA mismatch repair protein MutL